MSEREEMLTREALATGEAFVTTMANVRKLRDRAVAIAITDYTTLHPAAEWTEADGAVLCWHIEFGEIVGDPVVSRPVSVVGSLARAAWEQSLPFWSRIPKVELPSQPKEANHAR